MHSLRSFQRNPRFLCCVFANTGKFGKFARTYTHAKIYDLRIFRKKPKKKEKHLKPVKLVIGIMVIQLILSFSMCAFDPRLNGKTFAILYYQTSSLKATAKFRAIRDEGMCK